MKQLLDTGVITHDIITFITAPNLLVVMVGAYDENALKSGETTYVLEC